jgi:FkbM family methyltransferase
MSLARRAIDKIRRTVTFEFRRIRARKRGIRFSRPNYVYLDRFDPSKILIDVGCGHVAEFSKHIMTTYGSDAYGVDPTRKHAAHLEALELSTGGKFHHVPVAVAASNGTITFNESKQNESGSLLRDHTNVKADEIVTYEVEAVTLSGLLDRIGKAGAEYIKLDLEGAEYQLLEAAQKRDLEPFKQIFVEFHHHAVDRYSRSDTEQVVRSLEAMGLTSVTFDDHNYLFYWG